MELENALRKEENTDTTKNYGKVSNGYLNTAGFDSPIDAIAKRSQNQPTKEAWAVQENTKRVEDNAKWQNWNGGYPATVSKQPTTAGYKSRVRVK